MGKVRISGTRRHSSVNGPGVRYVLFFQGCPHRCPGCQNPETLDAAGGTETTTEALTEDILATRYLDGVTFSGGDPLMQPEALAEIARAVRDETGAEGVGVVMECQHLCMMMRGVEKQNATMSTSAVLGSFHDDAATRAEFLSIVTSGHHR